MTSIGPIELVVASLAFSSLLAMVLGSRFEADIDLRSLRARIRAGHRRVLRRFRPRSTTKR
jgi:hypothetical protein